MSKVHAQTHVLPTPLIPAHSVAPLPTAQPATPGTDLSHLLYKITTPYIASGFTNALLLCNLTHCFPNLVHELIYGSPISNPPPLTSTFIPNNLTSVQLNPAFITTDLVAEQAAGCKNGPFSIEEAHQIFNSHFRTSPLGLVPKPSKDPGTLHIIQHLSKCDGLGASMNDWIDSDDFPTKWSSGAECADFVSPFSCTCVPSCASLCHAAL